jgi:hypothetical protein
MKMSSLFSQRAALVEQQKASHTFSISGKYGAIGRNFGSMPGIGDIQATVSVTLFDRDRNGVTDNIEVITAQTAHDSAQDDRVVALAQHADAVAGLVRALGATEQNYEKYLGESGAPAPSRAMVLGEQP